MQEEDIDNQQAIVQEDSRDFLARPEVLVEVRRMVEQNAQVTPLTKQDLDDLLTAVDEAAANAIRYGTSVTSEANIRVSCRATASKIEVQVRDFGFGFSVPSVPTMPAPDALGGRGLPLMVALTDSVSIASTPGGTTVTLLKRARRA